MFAEISDSQRDRSQQPTQEEKEIAGASRGCICQRLYNFLYLANDDQPCGIFVRLSRRVSF